jgi:hypothetical protein
MIAQHPLACAIKVTTVTVYATLFMHRLASLLRHVLVQMVHN